MWYQGVKQDVVSRCEARWIVPDPTNVLGLSRDPDMDMIFFDFSKLINILVNGCSTKRFILQILVHIFDPIGFSGPFIIRLKILLQELWAAEIEWDDKLPFSLDCKWQLWYPSVAAYGCIIYIREVTHDNRVIVKFVCSKSRVAPPKSLTLPRLELLVCLLSARLSKQLRNAHNFVNPTPEKDLKRGDVVLIEGTTKSKYLWPLGIIEDIIINREDHIRSYLVRTAKGQYKHPIQLIYPLEII
ncbi:integrase catalytic domain-containing protein [Nephila pilipes]|uniref:Integrase catalytic domain-containing protein n=1 Tax=Nephila pilipes TaxID=299642 RepID=A0A8X6PR72_NEPPI|nr:integrase catalytic domain-containing protein [Nephila pilipes]